MNKTIWLIFAASRLPDGLPKGSAGAGTFD